MFLYKSHKKLEHKQTSVIGFVIAIISILVTVVMVYGLPLALALLSKYGVYHLNLFLLGLSTVIFLSVQGLLLFGFPLFYAQDKKSHMTGFQILTYSWIWMIVIALVIVAVSLALFQAAPMSVTDLTM
ncbi:hypothetical protein KKC94_01035 [Patescibacteria group bacterium]|nr:hypothetical protein [Patescibacteria group bacterium]